MWYTLITSVALWVSLEATSNREHVAYCEPIDHPSSVNDVLETGTISIQDDVLVAYSGYPVMQVIAVDIYSLPGLSLVKDFNGCGSNICYYNLISASVSHGNYRIVVTRANATQFYRDLEYN